MTTSTDLTGLPDWLHPGATVAHVATDRDRGTTYTEATVTRVTKRDVILRTPTGDEHRFRRADLRTDPLWTNAPGEKYLQRYDSGPYATGHTAVYRVGSPAAEKHRVTARAQAAEWQARNAVYDWERNWQDTTRVDAALVALSTLRDALHDGAAPSRGDCS